MTLRQNPDGLKRNPHCSSALYLPLPRPTPTHTHQGGGNSTQPPWPLLSQEMCVVPGSGDKTACIVVWPLRGGREKFPQERFQEMGLLLQRECTAKVVTACHLQRSAAQRGPAQAGAAAGPTPQLSLPPLLLVTPGPFCKGPLPSAPAPALGCGHCHHVLPGASLPLYFITESGPPGRGAEWCRVWALEPVREGRISSALTWGVRGLLLHFSVPWFPWVVCEKETANTGGALRSLHSSRCSVTAAWCPQGPSLP